MLIELENLIKLIDDTFDFILIVDDAEKVYYCKAEFLTKQESQKQIDVLADILHSETHKLVRDAISRVITDGLKEIILKPTDAHPFSIKVKISFIKSEENILYIFTGNKIFEFGDFASSSDWEKVERIKELACIYDVAEWIEVSKSVKEFFDEFPKYIKKGMHYPEHAHVYSVYQGVSSGEKPQTENAIRSNIIVSGEKCGELIVAYDSDDLKILREEQKMLNEIARMLGLALDRKELTETLAQKEKEAAKYTSKLLELEKDIVVKANSLKEHSARLETVNSYLLDVNKGFDEAKVRLETMFQAIPDMMAIIDIKRNVIMTNRANVLPGNKCYKTFFDSETPCVDCRLRRIINEKMPITIEIEHENLWFEVHALPIFNANREVEGIIEFYRDITYKKTIEQQLQQADKLASLGQLVSGVGHEINNPNQFIRGNIKIIQQAMDDILPILDEYAKQNPELKIARLKYSFFREHIMTLVNDMSNGSERIKRIVQDLKGFARKDEGQLIDKVDINSVIAECTRLVHNQVHNFAEIELNLEPEIHVFMGNAQKIEQVLINLVINASQAMPEEKRGLIKVTTKMDADDVIVEIEDNGKGMSENTMSKIFDPFFTTKRAKGGTGLGLSIAFKIIEEHKGQISVTSKLGVGSKFTVRIPARQNKGNTELFQRKER